MYESNLPLTCRNGHPWGASELTVSCRQPGCDATWHGDAHTLIHALADRSTPAISERLSAQAAGALDAAWILLMQAHEHQVGLLRPSHPSAARIAALQTWIHACVTAIDKAQRSEALIARSDEAAHMTEIAAKIVPVVDAFQVYASTLKKFRNTELSATGSPRPESLAAVVDNERVLVDCRAALRASLQQLTEALQTDR